MSEVLIRNAQGDVVEKVDLDGNGKHNSEYISQWIDRVNDSGKYQEHPVAHLTILNQHHQVVKTVPINEKLFNEFIHETKKKEAKGEIGSGLLGNIFKLTTAIYNNRDAIISTAKNAYNVGNKIFNHYKMMSGNGMFLGDGIKKPAYYANIFPDETSYRNLFPRAENPTARDLDISRYELESRNAASIPALRNKKPRETVWTPNKLAKARLEAELAKDDKLVQMWLFSAKAKILLERKRQDPNIKGRTLKDANGEVLGRFVQLTTREREKIKEANREQYPYKKTNEGVVTPQFKALVEHARNWYQNATHLYGIRAPNIFAYYVKKSFATRPPPAVGDAKTEVTETIQKMGRDFKAMKAADTDDYRQLVAEHREATSRYAFRLRKD